MTAVDRITAIVAEHYGTAAPNGGWVCNACDAPLVEAGATSRHVAERIAAAADLAVIEIEPPDEIDGVSYFTTDDYDAVEVVIDREGFIVKGSFAYAPSEALAVGAQWISAARAAEAVGDR